MNKARKKITLPSGATCTVRKVSGNDFVTAGLSPVISALQDSVRKKRPTELDDKTLQQMVKVTSMMLLRCVGVITNEDGSKVKIVDKPIDDLADDETTIEELDQVDANMIVDEIHRLSGLKKEAATAAAPFPEEQAAPAGSSSDSEGLRPAANGAAGA